jgi:hypothetical protein
MKFEAKLLLIVVWIVCLKVSEGQVSVTVSTTTSATELPTTTLASVTTTTLQLTTRAWQLPLYLKEAMESPAVKDFQILEIRGETKTHTKCTTLQCLIDKFSDWEGILVAVKKN